MKKLIFFLIIIVVFLMSIGANSPTPLDVTGTWTGKTVAMPFQIELSLTLALTNENGKLVGQLSDNMNFLRNQITDIKINEGILSFNVIANVGESPTVHFRLSVSRNQLSGEWKSTDGVTGKWTAKRKTDSPEKSANIPTKKTPSDYTGAVSRFMAENRVPGIGMAVIENYQTLDTEYLGTICNQSKKPVTEDTYFQGASVSKAVTATIVYHFIDRGMFELDTDVNRYLKSWKVPENEYTKEKKVTLRELLSHRSGLPATNFPQKAGAGNPTLTQILNGESPAMNKPAFPVRVPDTQWQYSNIGYVVIQQLLEDNLRKPFVQLAKEIVFEPLGMKHSTFIYPIPSERRPVEAIPHRADGTPGEPMINSVAQAHGGLMTTARDMSVFVIEIMNAYRGRSTRLISRKSARIMVDEGVGVFNNGNGPSVSFYHPGQGLPGTTSWIIGYPQTGQGAVVLTNGEKGLEVTQEIISLIKTRYNWPE